MRGPGFGTLAGSNATGSAGFLDCYRATPYWEALRISEMQRLDARSIPAAINIGAMSCV
jgi:hypothetical protein